MPQSQIITAGNAINRSHPLNRGLVSWWLNLPNRQGGGGNTFRDLAGRNHGTLTNGPTWSGARGRLGGRGSLSFDGSDDRVALSSQFSVANGVTYTAWIYPTLLNGNYAFRANKKTIFATNASAFLQWWADSDLTQIADNVFTLTTNRWWHVAVTQTGTTYAFYVNGQPGRTGTTNALDDASSAATLGSFSTAFLWNGLLDDLRDYNRALSAAEVLALYQESRQGYPNALNWIRRRVYVPQDGGGDTGFAHRLLLLGVG